MGQKKGFDLSGIKPPVLPVSTLHLSPALKKSAVHKHLFATGAFNEKV
jgi:hypothetical protein